jgi:hypothetical protein
VASPVLHEAAERTREARTMRRSRFTDEQIAYLGSREIRELRQLREEKAKLKRLVADIAFDKHLLAEFVRRKSSADA